MSTLLEEMRRRYNFPTMEAVKEWSGPNGEMGVYTTIDPNFSLLVVFAHGCELLIDLKTCKACLIDAEIIAAFAGLQAPPEKLPPLKTRHIKDYL